MVFVGDELRLIQLEPRATIEAKCATVEATANEHDLKAGIPGETGAQQVIDVTGARDVAQIRAALAPEAVVNFHAVLVHEQFGELITANRVSALGIAHANSAAVEGCVGDRFHGRCVIAAAIVRFGSGLRRHPEYYISLARLRQGPGRRTAQ